MFPIYWGNGPMGNPAGYAPGILGLDYPGLRELPEEIRAALDERRGEFHNEEEMRRLVHELMLRR